MKRYKIKIEYDGTPFIGWQRQENGQSIQGAIEDSIKNIFGETITIFGAGRTDAGVHAMGQVAHFDINNKELEPFVIKNALNDHLRPFPIAILDVDEVDNQFHVEYRKLLRQSS